MSTEWDQVAAQAVAQGGGFVAFRPKPPSTVSPSAAAETQVAPRAPAPPAPPPPAKFPIWELVIAIPAAAGIGWLIAVLARRRRKNAA